MLLQKKVPIRDVIINIVLPVKSHFTYKKSTGFNSEYFISQFLVFFFLLLLLFIEIELENASWYFCTKCTFKK